MKSIVFSPLAQSDIDEIWNYTLQQWGQAQAVIYTESLRDSTQALASGRAVGRKADIRKGYYKYQAGEHFIYYKETEAEITVIRILHKRMDVGRHL